MGHENLKLDQDINMVSETGFQIDALRSLSDWPAPSGNLKTFLGFRDVSMPFSMLGDTFFGAKFVV